MTRTCVGCRQEDERSRLVRLIIGPDDTVAIDLLAREFGRGAFLHAQPNCIAKAPKGLAKSFRKPVSVTASELTAMLHRAAMSRVLGLLSSGARAGLLALGTSPVKDALERGAARVVLVATDARAAATTPWIERVVARGEARAFGTKELLGTATGRSEIGVLAVLDDGLASALAVAIAISEMPMPRAERGTSLVTEVG